MLKRSRGEIAETLAQMLSEPIVLLDTAAMFASAESCSTSATADNFWSEPSSCEESVKASNMGNQRPEDPSIAWLWDRGYQTGKSCT